MALSFCLMSLRSLLAIVAGVMINAIAQGRCGWLMHEAGHTSLTGNAPLDKRIQELVYGAGCGMSAAWWRSQHNKHHAVPQKLEHDVDLETLPLVAFNRRIVERLGPGPHIKRFLSTQAYTFAPLLCLLIGLSWSLYVHPRHIVRTRRAFEALCCAARYVGWCALMYQMGYSWCGSIGVYVMSFALACTYIFVNFAVSHTHLPVTEADEHLHWIEYGALHTTNIRNSAFVTWWMCFLNFQIEHHLFPTMPQFRHPLIAPRVSRLFAKHGLPYDSRPYTRAIRDTFANLRAVGTT